MRLPLTTKDFSWGSTHHKDFTHIFATLVRASSSRGKLSLSFVDNTLTTMTKHISEFVGVYDADSTLIGEVSYWIGARLGTTHCSLCELTHGIFTKKTEWKECSRSLSVPFHTFHRNDAPADVLAAANGLFPLVLARFDTGLEVALTSVQLEEFDGSTTRFAEWLTAFVSEHTS